MSKLDTQTADNFGFTYRQSQLNLPSPEPTKPQDTASEKPGLETTQPPKAAKVISHGDKMGS